MNREDIIKLLASLVTRNGDFPHIVDLSNPDLSVVVEVIKVQIILIQYVLYILQHISIIN